MPIQIVLFFTCYYRQIGFEFKEYSSMTLVLFRQTKFRSNSVFLK